MTCADILCYNWKTDWWRCSDWKQDHNGRPWARWTDGGIPLPSIGRKWCPQDKTYRYSWKMVLESLASPLRSNSRSLDLRQWVLPFTRQSWLISEKIYNGTTKMVLRKKNGKVLSGLVTSKPVDGSNRTFSFLPNLTDVREAQLKVLLSINTATVTNNLIHQSKYLQCDL